MGRIWVTSDLHIGHNRDFIYQKRGFESAEEHDQALVSNWNELVAAEDEVYILGDVMSKYSAIEDDFSYGLSVLKQLNGKLVILRGNHDSREKIEYYKTCQNVVSAGDAALYLDYPDDGGYHFYLTHYPTLVSHRKLKTLKNALLNLYGHTHQKEHFFNGHPYMYCVCLDAHEMRPVLLDEILEEIRHKKFSYREEEQPDLGIR